jgi:hypothetical protein
MSVNTKMTAIANEIRELSGTTGTMGLDAMASNISSANSEIDNQENIMSQIVSALEGKASPGQGEDVTAETEAYTSSLTTLESVINSLPDAGSGGTSLETCTVTISCAETFVHVAYTTVVDGVVTGKVTDILVSGEINVIQNGNFVIFDSSTVDGLPVNTNCTNCEVTKEMEDSSEGNLQVIVVKLNSGAVTASIVLS